MRTLIILIVLSLFCVSYGEDNQIFDNMLLFYQSWISPSRGFSCPMYPSCSEYSKIAFQKRDPVEAFFLTVDRLNRCGHDLDNYVPILATNLQTSLRYYDPVDAVQPVPALFYRADDLSQAAVYSPGNIQTVQNAETASSEESKLFNFILKLYMVKEYDKAAVEEMRFLSYYPASYFREKIYTLNMQTLIHLRDFERLKITGNYYTNEFTNSALTMSYLLGIGAYESENYHLAAYYLDSINNGNRDKALLYEGLSSAKLYNWDKSIQYFTRIPAGSQESIKANEFIDLSIKGKDINLKSPLLAGILGVIPGLGYVYDGYFVTGLSAFIINGLLIGSTWWFSSEQNYFMAYLLGGISISWYAGNIYGSVVTADKVNHNLLESHADLFHLQLDF